ncbi:MAG: hydroxymethylbilane synthase [Chloroflexi bacterium]|nr:hydroxymethylbilane synthase [Chloroflexota bacterium]
MALWQSEHVIEKLRHLWPDHRFSIKKITTQGDEVLDVPLARIGGRGLFVKEIESALISGEIDLAVHSLKDMPSQIASGLELAAIGEREDARDVLVSRDNLSLAQLPPGARIGTSSPRRAAQLLAYRPDLQLVNMRGNLDTRLRKARSEDYEGAILAAAGLIRMGWAGYISEYIPMDVCLPAIGQGALAIETRAGDEDVERLVAPLDHKETRAAVVAERALMRALGGGCQAPVGAYGLAQGNVLELRGVVASLDGERVLRERIAGSAGQAEQLGQELANILLSLGAAEILEAAKG